MSVEEPVVISEALAVDLSVVDIKVGDYLILFTEYGKTEYLVQDITGERGEVRELSVCTITSGEPATVSVRLIPGSLNPVKGIIIGKESHADLKAKMTKSLDPIKLETAIRIALIKLLQERIENGYCAKWDFCRKYLVEMSLLPEDEALSKKTLSNFLDRNRSYFKAIGGNIRWLQTFVPKDNLNPPNSLASIGYRAPMKVSRIKLVQLVDLVTEILIEGGIIEVTE